MTRAHVLECPACGGPLRFQIPFCAYCRAPVTWSETLRLDRGPLVTAEHYPKTPMLGAKVLRPDAIQTTPDGHIVHLRAGGAMWARSLKNTRDMCVAVTAIALEPHAGFAAVARAHTDGGIVDAYMAVVVPGLRSVRLARICEGTETSALVSLRDWECSPYVAPAGHPNTIELRAADTLLQLFVNGERIFSTVDAGLGFGSYGWRALSLQGPGRVLFRALEVFSVATSMRA